MMLLKRLPPFHDVLPVFAVIATMFYGWTMVIFLWKLPGWLFFLNTQEIVRIFAYQMTTNLIESLCVLLLLLLLCMTLPSGVLKAVFVVRGSMVGLILIGSMMLFLNRYVSVGSEFGGNMVWWMLGAILIAIAVAVLSTQFRLLRVSISWIADQLIVFLLVLMPLTVLSIIYILVHPLL